MFIYVMKKLFYSFPLREVGSGFKAAPSSTPAAVSRKSIVARAEETVLRAYRYMI